MSWEIEHQWWRRWHIKWGPFFRMWRDGGGRLSRCPSMEACPLGGRWRLVPSGAHRRLLPSAEACPSAAHLCWTCAASPPHEVSRWRHVPPAGMHAMLVRPASQHSKMCSHSAHAYCACKLCTHTMQASHACTIVYASRASTICMHNLHALECMHHVHAVHARITRMHDMRA